jgi:DeoR/GlpR family transcriptional regulator of sugar metabolism
MFGNKKAKQDRLVKEIEALRSRGEMSRTQLANEVQVSLDTIEDDLATLHEDDALLCEHKGKISLLEHWFGKRSSL